MTETQMIKAECVLMYEQILFAEKRLKELRAICKHENTFEDWVNNEPVTQIKYKP